MNRAFHTIAALLISAPLLQAQITDADGDGMSDIWEGRYLAGPILADIDTDGDGHLNRHEAIAGTDPFSTNSNFRISRVHRSGRDIEIDFSTEPGKCYEVHFGPSPDPNAPDWQGEGTLMYGTGEKLTAFLSSDRPLRARGGLCREVWTGLPGTEIDDLRNHLAFPTTPDGVQFVRRTRLDRDAAIEEGSRMRGWITAPESGEYYFHLDTDYTAELHLSTDADAANASKACEVLLVDEALRPLREARRVSGAITLEAGERYYIELLHKHGGGFDRLDLSWALPSDTNTVATIEKDHLEPWLDLSGSRVNDLLSSNGTSFVCVQVKDLDADGDFVTTWEEQIIEPLNPFSSHSAPNVIDFTAVQALMGATANTITVSTATADAFEKEGTEARLRIERNGNLDPLTILFTLSGNPDPIKGSAGAADYTLEDEFGTPITSSVTLPFGATTVDVVVKPVKDTDNEVPEMLTLTVAIDPAYDVGTIDNSAVHIKDASPAFANRRLFVAYMASENNADTTATGISTVRLEGDNAVGLVNVNFTGLTSQQTAAHIHAANPLSGPILESLPNGQVQDHVWNVVAGAIHPTDQDVLDALFSGSLYVNVHSMIYPAGEIRGNLGLTEGFTGLKVPKNPPNVSNLGPADQAKDIIRFLTQATFGPTTNDIAYLTAKVAAHGNNRISAYTEWIDEQMNATLYPPPSLLAYVDAADAREIAVNAVGFDPNEQNARRGWWMFAVKSPAQLRMRMAFALSQIFVTSTEDGTIRDRHRGMANYYDMLIDQAFDDYEGLLGDITHSPVMGVYLSHLRNQKEQLDGNGATLVSPDENYAREIMQLFSVGLLELHQDGSIKLNPNGLPIPTYDQFTITEMARVMTGLSFSKRDGGVDNTSFNLGNGGGSPNGDQTRWMHPMKMFENFHDDGEKAILNHTVIPPGLGGDLDLTIACAVLANHPNVPPFLARRLIQRMVTSNPSKGYIYRTSQVFINSGGDLGELVKAILLDSEARNLNLIDDLGYGKQKEPIIRYLQLIRAFDGKSNLPLTDLSAYGYPAAELAKFPAGTTEYRYYDTTGALGQTPLRPPSVFNWFLPDYQVPGNMANAGLHGPEFQINTENSVVQVVNFHYNILYNTDQSVNSLTGQADPDDDDVELDKAPLQNLYDTEILGGATVTEAATTVIDYLDYLLNGGIFKARYELAPAPNPRTELIEAAAGFGDSTRIRRTLYLMGTIPEFMIQK